MIIYALGATPLERKQNYALLSISNPGGAIQALSKCDIANVHTRTGIN